MKIAIGSDHGGFALKKELASFLASLGYEVTDFGCADEKSVDYPDIAVPVAEAVVRGEYARGILICGTGVGISISANKVRGARCAHCSEETTARLSRAHNDANLLALGGRIIGVELAKSIAETFLATSFSGDDRHVKRINKIGGYEA
ncbi:MAG TPA: ribose 5-phosphate isomerase B [Clostridia bacterium]|nr:ribose 5-phosphate isomerase B [Clostridia bacterium]